MRSSTPQRKGRAVAGAVGCGHSTNWRRRELIANLLPRPAAVVAPSTAGLLQIPRNLDVRLLHFRRDLIATPPETWAGLFDIAEPVDECRGSNGDPAFYGFLFPGPRLRVVRDVLRAAGQRRR